MHDRPLDPLARIPDAIGEVIGWRAWKLTETPQGLRLRSATRDDLWLPEQPMEAHCPKDHSKEPTPGVPGDSCTCGLYAARAKNHLLSMGYNMYHHERGLDSLTVCGRVAMWGKVIAGTQGWRAQYARPFELHVPYERWKLVAPLQAAYPSAKVILANTLREDPDEKDDEGRLY